jgi:WD40 repeat protein
MFPDSWFRAYVPSFVTLFLIIGSVAGICGCGSNTWPEQDERLIKSFRAHEFGVVDIEFSADGKWVFTCGQDGIKQWDAATFKLVNEQEFDLKGLGYSTPIYSMAADVHRPLLYLGTKTQEIQVWNYETRQIAGTIPTRKRWSNNVPALATSPDGKLLAVAENGGAAKRKSTAEDFTILLWDLEGQREPGRFSGHGAPVGSLVFLPGGKFLLSLNSVSITVWCLETMSMISHRGPKETGKYDETAEPKHKVAFAPQGIRSSTQTSPNDRKHGPLLSELLSSIHGTVVGEHYLAGVENGIEVRHAQDDDFVDFFRQFGNGCSVDAVAVSPDGKLLVSGGDGAAMGGFGIRDDQRSRNLCFWRLDKKK